MVVGDSNAPEDVRVIMHNLQRVKTQAEILYESQYYLSLVPKEQGKRNDLEDDSQQQGSNIGGRYDKVAELMGGIVSGQTIRRMNKVVEAEKAAEEEGNTEFLNLGLLSKMKSDEITPSHAERLIDNYKRNYEERLTEKDQKIDLVEPALRYKLFNKPSSSIEEIESNSVQTVFTSPPYFRVRNYGNGTDNELELGHEKTPDEFINKLLVHFAEVYRVLKDEGSFFLNIGEYGYEKFSPLVTNKLLVRLCDEIGFKCVNEIIWHKTNSKVTSNKRRLGCSYEKVFHLVKNVETYYYKPIRIWRDEPMILMSGFTNKGIDGTSFSLPSIKRPYYHFRDFIDSQKFEDVLITAVANTSVFKKIDPDFDHPAPYDPKICLLGLLTTSRPNDLVMDCFSGTASTGEIAVMLGRRYVGFEKNTAFNDFAKKRMPFTTKGYDEKSVNFFESLKVD